MLTNNGYIINKKELTKPKITQILKDLTVSPKVNEGYQTDAESFTVYKEDKDTLTIPRYYAAKKIGEPKDCIDINNSHVDFEFVGKLRDYQQTLVDDVLKTIKSSGGGILQLHTGYGKTTIALYLASVLKLKTLIIVHKTFLQDQWYDRIKQFTNASVGMIRQKKVDVEGKDIVIGMLQSISMIDYDQSIFKDFQLLIVDECHHMGSKVFSQALLKVFPKYTIGLSATPKRQDGLTKVIKWFLGDIIAKVERKGTNAVYIKSFNYSSTDKLFVEKKRWFKGKVKPDPTKMVSNLCIINDRNLFIANIINSLRKKDERKTLILSGRIEHLKTLKKLVEKLIQDDIKSGNCDTDEVKTAFYIGGMKDYELKDSAEADIIFATYSMAEEGLDIDGLNTLILATPKKNIIQSIGRIMRKPIKEGDVNPLIVDIIDDLSVFPNWSNPRTKYYKTNKYTIHEYKAMNDKMISLKDYMVKHNLIKNITPDMDFRKEYIVSKYGLDEYNFQKDTDFYDFPDEIFNYSCNLNDIFEIKHNYEEEIKEMTITI
ncbi:superfamily II DNA or RNA helicase [Klosneuvirus KNV1]|uniref:Superfamily II DNA or RNA helicase n=1 Tax=Klosneuvirus KNV1 TaxID=1977640 RepID=A0A1V0SLK0_9VIRU|nr:superfamily II DNA or RNA helicase [Klosneuvirus KNV1]